ncbi:MAG TPA: RT0821/Lpp0805 family surface protein [Stellaceae bacterium]|nr:RT0821/Lpp0805 family surface protein [Stellaceae bacterium]
MNANPKISTVVLTVATSVSLAACVSDPYSQEHGHTTNTQVPQPYPTNVYVPADQPVYTPPQPVYTPPQPVYAPSQPVYAPPQYAPVQTSYSQILQSESANVSRGWCDRRLLAGPGAYNQFAGTAAGPLVAGEIHVGMTPADDSCVGLTLEFARNDQVVAWQNPDNGALYQVTPITAYQQPNGLHCRQYTTVASSNGLTRTVNDTACRLPTGSWQLQS